MACSGKVTANWKAPAEDGGILVWPEGRELVEGTRRNFERLKRAEGVRIGGVALAELRLRLRQWIGHEVDAPLVAAGHQIELLHPGVWAKDVLINELARQVDGVAYHFAVDTDAPKHLQLRWPGGSMPITDDAILSDAAWADLLETPTPGHVKALESAVAAEGQGWGFAPMIGEFLEALRRGGMESKKLTWVLTNAIHRLDWELGLKHDAMLCSPMWSSPGYLLFVHHILSRAGSFAAAYNGMLAEYRRQEGIKNPGRPWPDLKVSGDRCEAPFWLDGVDEGERERACMERVGNGWRLRLRNGREFELDKTKEDWEAAEKLGWFLAMNRARLSPRALTLTAFLRLAVVDQFVHGIGGGRYDCVTNGVIERWFGIEPPGFSVTTATLLFPAAVGTQRVKLAPLIQEGRKLRHGDASDEKMRQVRAIAAMPRRSAQRQQAFYEMHRGLRQNLQSEAYRTWEKRLEEARELIRQQAGLFDRELFYGMQPRERLEGLIEAYRRQLA